MAQLTAIEEVRQKAQKDFMHQRVAAMSRTFFPDDAIHENFMKILQKLLKYNSKKQMGIHQKTWENMCNKTRQFFLPEIEVAFEILERATPNELIRSLKNDYEILKEYNEVEYPKVLAILEPMRDMYNRIDKAIAIPLANKINSDCKMSLKMPIGTAIDFVVLPNHG